MRPRVILALVFISLLGFALRAYHLNYPSIGYHNMKENEYLSIAEEMNRTGDFLARRVYFYNSFDQSPVMKLYPQVPLVSYQALIIWKLFGDSLWPARLVNVLFGIGSVILIYLISRVFFKDSKFPLFSAFLMAIMPLAVFFSRNLQPESPALFFMLLGNLFYLKFAANFKKSFLFWGGFSFYLAWVYKMSFLIGLLPCLPLLIYSVYREKKFSFRNFAIFVLPYLFILFTILFLFWVGQWYFDSQETMERVKIFAVFSYNYWQNNAAIICNYVVKENFGLPFTLFLKPRSRRPANPERARPCRGCARPSAESGKNL